MAEVKEQKEERDESKLANIFNQFWSEYGSRNGDVDSWKDGPNGSIVVDFLKNKTPQTNTLRESAGYINCKRAWESAKGKGSEEATGFDEGLVRWDKIKSLGGVTYYVLLRNWPESWLSSENKHTRGYVLSNIDKPKGYSTIIDTARKKLGLIKEKKEKEDAEKNETKKEGEEQNVTTKPKEQKDGKVTIWAKIVNYARKSNEKALGITNSRYILPEESETAVKKPAKVDDAIENMRKTTVGSLNSQNGEIAELE